MPKQKQSDKAEFILDTNESLSNAIRRNTGQIPILAIEDVEIHKNDSALYDEIISHRLGLIPLKDTRKLNEPEKCSCEGKGCAKCQLKISLKAKGPAIVYSGDLKGDVEIIYDKMPIVILDKDQELEFVAFAQLVKGIKHTKFSPGLIYYRNISDIKIKNSENAEKIISKLGDSIINIPKSKIKTGDIYKCTKDEDFITAISDNLDSIEIALGKEIVFFIESWGQMNAKEIFSEAVKSLNNNLKEVSKALKK